MGPDQWNQFYILIFEHMEMKKKNGTEILQQMINGRVVARERQGQQSETGRSQEQDFNYHYYQEYKRLYLTGYYLAVQMKQLLNNKEDLWSKLSRLEKKTEEFKDNIRGQPPEKKKRYRRTAEEIERKFVCEVEICQKCYGSEGSLQQHIKLKHPELYELKSYAQSRSDSL